MKITTTLIAVILGLFIAGGAAFAGETPIASDSRIRTLVYSENEIFRIVTEYGYQSNIEFADGEKVQTLSVGDSVAFKVTPANSRLFIRSMQSGKTTNMTIITNLRAYQFELSSVVESSRDLIYVLRFYYPEDNRNDVRGGAGVIKNLISKNTALAHYNFNYSLSGSDNISPVKIFDDGRATFFKFSGDTKSLDLYAVSADGVEHPLQSRKDGEYLVVDSVFSVLSFRRGADVICVFNENS